MNNSHNLRDGSETFPLSVSVSQSATLVLSAVNDAGTHLSCGPGPGMRWDYGTASISLSLMTLMGILVILHEKLHLVPLWEEDICLTLGYSLKVCEFTDTCHHPLQLQDGRKSHSRLCQSLHMPWFKVGTKWINSICWQRFLRCEIEFPPRQARMHFRWNSIINFELSRVRERLELLSLQTAVSKLWDSAIRKKWQVQNLVHLWSYLIYRYSL